MNKLKEEINVLCPICRNREITFQSSYRNTSIYFNNLRRVLCNKCGLVFANPMPRNKKLEQYNSNYHLNAHGGHKRDNKLNSFFKGIAKTRLNTIESKIKFDYTNDYKVLEIGPGPGVFAKEWLTTFPKSNYYAIETDLSIHDNLQKLGVQIIKDIENTDYKHYFDIIIISHVLEHVADPLSFLRSYLSTLKNNGNLFIEVPCRDWEHKDLDEPHLLFFDKKSMLQLFEELNLKTVFLGYFGTKIKDLKNPIFKLISKIREKLFYRDINLYHPERGRLYKILNSKLETNAIVNHYAHKEQNLPSWWLRAIIKK